MSTGVCNGSFSSALHALKRTSFQPDRLFSGRLSPRGLRTSAYAAGMPRQLQIGKTNFEKFCSGRCNAITRGAGKAGCRAKPQGACRYGVINKTSFKTAVPVGPTGNLPTSKRNSHELFNHHHCRCNDLGPERLRPPCCRSHSGRGNRSGPCRCYWRHGINRFNGLNRFHGFHRIDRFHGLNRLDRRHGCDRQNRRRHRGDHAGRTSIAISLASSAG